MKTIIATILLLTGASVITTIHAQDLYKILFLNTPSIQIGKKTCKTGDCFEGNSQIEWTHPDQAMKVLNMQNQRQSIILSKQYKAQKSTSLTTYLTQNKHLSTRNGTALTLPQLKKYLANTFYLLDSIEVKTLQPTDQYHYFYIAYTYQKEIINKRIRCHEGAFVIDRSLFIIDGRPIEPFDTTLKVFYLDEKSEKQMLVTDRLHLISIKQECK